MIIRMENFKGIAPRIAPHLLPDNVGQTAKNCKLLSGALKPLNNPLTVLEGVGSQMTIFLYGETWLRWTTDVDVVRSAVLDDQFDRLYYTGDGAPKMTSSSLVGAGYPADYLTLGIPAPTNALTATVVALPAYSAASTYIKDDLVTEGGVDYVCLTEVATPEAFDSAKWSELTALDKELRAYVYTYVDSYGAQGPPSPSSVLVDLYPTQNVDLSAMDVAPAGDYSITKKYIYRTNVGSSGTEYQFDDEVDIATTTYSDTKKSYELGEVLLSTEWDAPPSDLEGLVSMPNGIMAGFRGKELCFCVPYQPHAWPVAYRYPVDFPIVALGVFGNSVVVTTEGMPYIATGTNPESMTPQKLETGYSCTSKPGLVDMGTSVIYPSPVGLVLASNGVMELVTSSLFTKDEWDDYNPSTIRAYRYGGSYVGFHSGGAFVFTPATGDFVTLDLTADAGFYDQADGNLFLLTSGSITKWDAGATQMTTEWTSPDRKSARPITMAFGQVEAEGYPVTFKYYADDALKHTRTVADDKPFTLPTGFKGKTHKASVSSAYTINRAYVAQDIEELRQV